MLSLSLSSAPQYPSQIRRPLSCVLCTFVGLLLVEGVQGMTMPPSHTRSFLCGTDLYLLSVFLQVPRYMCTASLMLSTYFTHSLSPPILGTATNGLRLRPQPDAPKRLLRHYVLYCFLVVSHNLSLLFDPLPLRI